MTQSELKKILNYDPSTGVFIWLLPVSKKICIGQNAGTIRSGNYRIISFCGKKYRAHQIAWLYMYGNFPEKDIDHINGDGFDNRIDNLREASKSENNQNQKRIHSHKKSSKFLGVYKSYKCESWNSRITVKGKRHNLGSFKTEIEAYNAYLSAKIKLHPFSMLSLNPIDN